MADRQTFNGASTEVPWADGVSEGLGNQYARHVKALYTAARFPLTAVAGVNDLTATLDPILDSDGLQDGMRFGLTAVAVNTAGMTLAINGGAAVPILTSDLGAIVPGQVQIGSRLSVEYVGGNFLVTGLLSGEGGGSYYEAITASTTWTRPAGFDDDRMVTVEAWGGGGGGGTSRGGGGGAYALLRVRLGDLPASVPVSIGAGGVSGNGTQTDGGNTTFGGLLTAYGGAGLMMHGGGSHQSGASGGAIGGGAGGSDPGNDATTESGGGAGANSTGNSAGGRAVRGGGGGGVGNPGGGGVSIYGGNGGSGTNAPTTPGGGGGGATTSGGDKTAGARGEVRIWI